MNIVILTHNLGNWLIAVVRAAYAYAYRRLEMWDWSNGRMPRVKCSMGRGEQVVPLH